MKTKANNTVNILNIYKTKSGIWCFDDADLSIVAEPFVGEINLICDFLAKGKKELTVYISEKKIPDSDVILNQTEQKDWYQTKVSGSNIEGWLCPCLLNYFKDYPKQIYVKINN